MIRVALAVLLATALVGVALPAMEVGDRAAAVTRTHAVATDLATTLSRFAAHNDPVTAGEAGARRVLTVRLPAGASLHVGRRLRWRVGGRTGHVGLDPTVETAAEGALTLRGGTHRLQLRYVRTPAGPEVTVRRFKSEAGTTPARVPERSRCGRRVCV